jgi:peptidoglycan/xylan/chitin deacetylase (PgdA/CDA1 family)
MENRQLTALLLTLLFVFTVPGTIIAQDTDTEKFDEESGVEIPAVITGSEPELADNILLTIDDCSSEEKTRAIFEFLLERNLRATFFPVSSMIVGHDPGLWQDIVEAGFEIGYHTRFHQGELTVPELDADFEGFTEDIRILLDDPDYTIQYVRPPWGLWNDDWLTWAQNNQLHTVRWNIVPRFDLTMEYFAAVLKHEDGGGIVLIHPRPTDIWWLEENMDAILELQNPDGEPFNIVTITEAFND